MTIASSKIQPIALAAALLITAGLASSALAEETQCRVVLGAITLDNVFVPDGAFCSMTATSIKGNMVVGTETTLNATRISVNGNVQTEGASRVRLGQPCGAQGRSMRRLVTRHCQANADQAPVRSQCDHSLWALQGGEPPCSVRPQVDPNRGVTADTVSGNASRGIQAAH